MNIEIDGIKTYPSTFGDLDIFTFFVSNWVLYYKANEESVRNTMCLAATGPWLTTSAFDMTGFSVVPHENISIKVRR